MEKERAKAPAPIGRSGEGQGKNAARGDKPRKRDKKNGGSRSQLGKSKGKSPKYYTLRFLYEITPLPERWKIAVWGHFGEVVRGIDAGESKNKSRETSRKRRSKKKFNKNITIIPFGGHSDPVPPIAGSCAVHLHLFYPDMAADFVRSLNNITVPFDLFVSAPRPTDTESLARYFREGVAHAQRVTVEQVENRGRDLMPLLPHFGSRLTGYDFVCHVHTKKSPQNVRKADWRRQLVHNVLGSPKTVLEILRLMERQKEVGLVFPAYHPALVDQISWGGNFRLAKELATRMGLSEPSREVGVFPAGSMFWIRGGLLKPLVEVLRVEDFPDEQGQVDGTLAHAIERLWPVVAAEAGYSVLQVACEISHDRASTYTRERHYPSPEPETLIAAVRGYRASKEKRRTTAVFTAITADYDQLPIPEILDGQYDYICFTDRPRSDRGVYQIKPLRYFNVDPVRSARFVKLHAHVLLPEYDVAIWVDANVIIRLDLTDLVESVIRSGLPLGGITHPSRNCIYDEAEACKRARYDQGDLIDAQMARYREEGMPRDAGLVETNLMVWNLRHPASREILNAWWREIDNGSRRDQLSLNYVLWRLGQSWHPLFGESFSLRDHHGFAYFYPHGAQAHSPTPDLSALPQRTIDPLDLEPYAAEKSRRLVGVTEKTIDVVVCVHDALEDTKACLLSLVPTLLPNHRLIIVDDGSQPPTGQFLQEFADMHPGVVVRRNSAAGGYTRAANAGLRLSSAEMVVLLNSDTIVAGDWLLKLADALVSTAGAGIVGPLSNAASHQSIPDHRNFGDQTAVNPLPPNVDVAAMNRHCEAWSSAEALPLVPLVHGFCLAIGRKVIDAIGYFDEELFPDGYGEENDYCLRATDAGFVLVVATHTYVYHAKSKSYQPERRAQKVKEGAEALRRKYPPERLAKAVRSMDRHPILVAIRERAEALYAEDRLSA